VVRSNWRCLHSLIPPTEVGGSFQIQPTDRVFRFWLNPTNGVSGYFRSSLHDALGRQDLNNPPTPVGGISEVPATMCRLDLNQPPTAVGGIRLLRLGLFGIRNDFHPAIFHYGGGSSSSV
jgi:hypothetical protein